MNWTEEEKTWLKENYGKTPLGECATHLGRPEVAVRSYAVGVLKLHTGRQEFWTQEDHTWLVSNYPTMTSEDCAKHLNRPVGSVTSRAKKYGLRKSGEHLSTVFHLWSDNEREWLIANFPNLSTQACAEHLDRPVGSVKSYAEGVLRLRKTPERLREKQAEVGRFTRKHFDIQPPSEIGRKEYFRRFMAKWRVDNRDKSNAAARESRLRHLPEISIRNRESYQKIRHEVLNHYSNNTMRCMCCKADYEPVLTIDHISGGGREHARKVGGGSSMCRWLKKNGFPEGFQVLCYNCNCNKRAKGSCDCPFDFTQPGNLKQN